MKGHNHGLCRKCGKTHNNGMEGHNFGLCKKCKKFHIYPDPHPRKGKKHTEETKKKLSVIGKRKVISEETKKKISVSLKGRKLSVETRKKLSAAKKGEKNHFYGHNYSHGQNIPCKKCGKVHVHCCNWKGKKLSDETRKKISKANKGRKLSEERCKQISLLAKGQWTGEKNPRYGNKAPRGYSYEDVYGIERAKKLKEGHSERMRGKKNPNYGKPGTMLGRFGDKHPGFGHKVSEDHKRKLCEARLHQVFPKKDSKIEVKLQEELKVNGITSFEKHFPVFGQPDIAFPLKKIAVFADGDYWHSLPKSIKRDRQVNRTLEEKGWVVLRFLGSEIRENSLVCVQKIKERLENPICSR